MLEVVILHLDLFNLSLMLLLGFFFLLPFRYSLSYGKLLIGRRFRRGSFLVSCSLFRSDFLGPGSKFRRNRSRCDIYILGAKRTRLRAHVCHVSRRCRFAHLTPNDLLNPILQPQILDQFRAESIGDCTALGEQLVVLGNRLTFVHA